MRDRPKHCEAAHTTKARSEGQNSRPTTVNVRPIAPPSPASPVHNRGLGRSQDATLSQRLSSIAEGPWTEPRLWACSPARPEQSGPAMETVRAATLPPRLRRLPPSHPAATSTAPIVPDKRRYRRSCPHSPCPPHRDQRAVPISRYPESCWLLGPREIPSGAAKWQDLNGAPGPWRSAIPRPPHPRATFARERTRWSIPQYAPATRDPA